MSPKVRGILRTLVLGTIVFPPLATAQQPARVPRIGVLSPGSRGPSPLLDAFRQGLRELGYVEGQNVAIGWRFAEGKTDRLAELAAELVRLRVDVILTINTPATEAAKNAASTIPIVFTFVADPVGFGLVPSLARPGRNLTGLTTITAELSGKRLELLKETLPKVSRVAVLWNSPSKGAAMVFRETEGAGRQLGVQLQDVGVRGAEEIPRAFEAATRGRAGALLVIDDLMISSHQRRILDLAVKRRLPVISTHSDFAESGGLMSYGTKLPDQFRRAATFVDKILKGTKPADLPVEQPMRFELVINMKTAKALGIRFPPSIIVRADQVIQ